jgi:hypothetical protein
VSNGLESFEFASCDFVVFINDSFASFELFAKACGIIIFIRTIGLEAAARRGNSPSMCLYCNYVIASTKVCCGF